MAWNAFKHNLFLWSGLVVYVRTLVYKSHFETLNISLLRVTRRTAHTAPRVEPSSVRSRLNTGWSINILTAKWCYRRHFTSFFQCIPAHQRCDGFWDCSEFNSSDEKGWDLSTKFRDNFHNIPCWRIFMHHCNLRALSTRRRSSSRRGLLRT